MPTSGRPPLPRTAECPPPARAQSLTPPSKSARESRHQVEDELFDPPPDLICPISHEVFSDPVLNSAGQVYERSSIEQHLARHNTDPITGMRLASKVLTPVFFLKSRAAEFREAAARDCVERATDIGTKDAIRYVRRAAELCDALAAPVPGLSQDCLEYIKAHPSNVYDMPALHLFARGLLHAGQRDKAAAVYFTLLQEGADKAQQAGLLRQCLACWNLGAEAGAENDTVEMLAGFVGQSRAPSAVQIVDIAQEANLDHSFVSKFCELLLFRASPLGEESISPQEWMQQKQILLKYVQVSCTHIVHQQAVAEARVDEVMGAAEQLRSLVNSQRLLPPRTNERSKHAKGRRRGRLAAGLCLAATFLLPRPDLLAVRLAKAAAALAVAHSVQ